MKNLINKIFVVKQNKQTNLFEYFKIILWNSVINLFPFYFYTFAISPIRFLFGVLKEKKYYYKFINPKIITIQNIWWIMIEYSKERRRRKTIQNLFSLQVKSIACLCNNSCIFWNLNSIPSVQQTKKFQMLVWLNVGIVDKIIGEITKWW